MGENKRDGTPLVEQRTTDEALTEPNILTGEALDRRSIWKPSVRDAPERESFHFAGHDIIIRESMDSFGAVVWPGAIALSQFLENNQQSVSLVDRAVLEIGAGTGLLSIVACLLGARVTATDLPDVLPNLTFNLNRNTKGRCRHTPRAAALTWGQDLERDFPYQSHHYDYVLAGDLVYPHDHHEELLETMQHFCRAGSQTTVLWANKIRFQTDLRFVEDFQSSFETALILELPLQEVRIYKATAKE